MTPVEPVTIWNDNGPLLSGTSLEDATRYFENHPDDGDNMYVQDADDNEFELLSTGKWNQI